MNENFLPDEKEKTERKIQSDSFQWFHNTYPALRGLCYHVPNGGTRNVIEATLLGGMGVVAGIPDVVFHYKGKTWFFEFKDAAGRLSPEQSKIHNVMRSEGFIVYIVRTLESFQETIRCIINGESKTELFKIGLSKEEYYYRHRIFEFLYNQMGHCELVKLEDLVDEENMIKFVECVKDFIRLRFDEKDNFELLFTPDLKAIYKRINGQPYNVIFYNGRSVVDIQL